MHHVFLIVTILSVSACVSGCSLLAPQIDKTAGYAGKLVTQYCENTTEEVRAEIRTAVNAKAAPHSVTVTCAQ
jgi:hypothetical protein